MCVAKPSSLLYFFKRLSRKSSAGSCRWKLNSTAGFRWKRTAYVEAIRAAQHFIYIENQYFLESSFNWSNYRDLGANNLIPMEITLKIANKIRARERFSVYIVVPMWPEAVPTGTPTQIILFCTIQCK